MTASPTVSRPAPASSPTAFAGLDELRGAAIVAVAGVHVTVGFLHAAPRGSGAMWWALGIHMLTTFATPLFVALSMTGLALGYGRPMHVDATYAAFLARRARRVLPAYVFWTVLTLVRSEPAALADPARLAGHLLRGSAAYHLYFVPLIVSYYLLWPLLSRAATAARSGARVAIAIAAIGLATSAIVWRVVPATSLTAPLFWLGYATVGLAVAPYVATATAWRRLPRALLATLTAAAALVMIRHVAALLAPVPDDVSLVLATVIFQVPVMAYALTAMALAAAIVFTAPAPGPLGRALAELGRRSYGVYLAHVLVLEVIVQRLVGRPASADFGSPAWIATLVAQWGLCVALTWGVIAMLARAPGLGAFAGERPNAR